MYSLKEGLGEDNKNGNDFREKDDGEGRRWQGSGLEMWGET